MNINTNSLFKFVSKVPILYDMLTKSTVKARPTVLWCYKNKDDAISK